MHAIVACHASVVPFILQCPVAMPPSSLEDRIRELCAQVATAKNEAELRIILPQLQAAIHDHISYFLLDSEAFGHDSNAAD